MNFMSCIRFNDIVENLTVSLLSNILSNIIPNKTIANNIIHNNTIKNKVVSNNTIIHNIPYELSIEIGNGYGQYSNIENEICVII